MSLFLDRVESKIKAEEGTSELEIVSTGIPTDASDFNDATFQIVHAQNRDGARDDTPLPDDYERGTDSDQRYGFEVFVRVVDANGNVVPGPYLYPIAVHRDEAGDMIISVADADHVMLGG